MAASACASEVPPTPKSARKPSPRNLLIIPPCRSSTTCTMTRRNRFRISTISCGPAAALIAVNERISTNITVMTSSTPPSPGSRARICSAAFSPTCRPKVRRSRSFLAEFGDHVIKFADEQPEFVGAHQGNVKVKTSPRHGLSGAAQIVDWLHDEPADQDRGTRPNAMPTLPTNTASHCGLLSGDGGAKFNRSSEPIGQIPAEIAQSTPRARKESATAPGVRSARVPRKNTGNSPH